MDHGRTADVRRPAVTMRKTLLAVSFAGLAAGALTGCASQGPVVQTPPPARPAPLASAAAAPVRPPDVIFLPTPDPVVTAMLRLANVRPTDVVYDLGCGDGKIVVAAARDFGARGVGIDIDPQRILEANARARAAGVTDRVTFRLGDIFDARTRFDDATVVTLFLLPSLNERLRPRLWRELKPGTRVVSNSFDMGAAWPPEKTEQVDTFTIYFWTIPERTGAHLRRPVADRFVTPAFAW